MRKTQFILYLILAFVPALSHALMEVNTEFGYTRQVYGEDRENKLIERTYAGSLAMYLFGYTALEFNFTSGEQITIQADTTQITGTNVSIVSYQNTVESTIYGVGLRQAFAGKNARFKPTISLGYARNLVYDRTDYTYRDDTTGNQLLLFGTPDKRRVDSVFGTFSLQLGLSSRIGLSGSVRTVFPAFKTDLMKDYVKYTVGLIIYL